MPTPPPTAFPCTRAITGLGHRAIARITRAKPMKNSLPSASSPIAESSSNDAPAQKAPVPALRMTITRTSSRTPTDEISSAIPRSSQDGSELLLGCQKSTRATPSATALLTEPDSFIVDEAVRTNAVGVALPAETNAHAAANHGRLRA